MYDGWLTFPPKDENAKILRYMNLSKFIPMLETARALTRLKLEGEISKNE